jgi:hypothetical protein
LRTAALLGALGLEVAAQGGFALGLLPP